MKIILDILPSLCLLGGFISIIISNQKIINYNRTLQNFSTEEIIRLNMIVSVLQTQCSNPIVFELIEKLKLVSYGELPKGEKDFMDFIRKSMKSFQEKTWRSLQDHLKNAKDDEKDLIQKRMNKFNNVMDLIDTLDEGSSIDYVKLIAREVQKALVDDLREMESDV
jgi:hypothetical protein